MKQAFLQKICGGQHCSDGVVVHCSGSRGRRGIQAGIAEKKVSILERALEFHPGSDRLLMALLDAVSPCTPSTLPNVQNLYMHCICGSYCTYMHSVSCFNDKALSLKTY